MKNGLEGMETMAREYSEDPLQFLLKYCKKFWDEFNDFLKNQAVGTLSETVPDAQASQPRTAEELMRVFYKHKGSKHLKLYAEQSVLEDVFVHYPKICQGQAALVWVPTTHPDRQFFESCAESNTKLVWQLLSSALPALQKIGTVFADYWLVNKDTPRVDDKGRGCFACGKTLRAIASPVTPPWVPEGLPVFQSQHTCDIGSECLFAREMFTADVMNLLQKDKATVCWECLISPDSLISPASENVADCDCGNRGKRCKSCCALRARSSACLLHKEGEFVIDNNTAQIFMAVFPTGFDYCCLGYKFPYMGFATVADLHKADGMQSPEMKECISLTEKYDKLVVQVQDHYRMQIEEIGQLKKRLDLLEDENKTLKRKLDAIEAIEESCIAEAAQIFENPTNTNTAEAAKALTDMHRTCYTNRY